MADVFTPSERSRVMRQVKSQDTTPELTVRSLIHRLGYRYRLHAADLPGKPDIVLPRHRKVVFVNGCFWHRHTCAKGQELPRANRPYWAAKFDRTVARDRRNRRKLSAAGWRVLTVWECQTRPARIEKLRARIERFLSDSE